MGDLMSERTIRLCARLAVVWSLVFAAVHFFWALGGSTLLDVSAGPKLAAERPALFVLGGLWGVGVLCLVGAVVAWRLGLPRPRGLLGTAVRAAGWTAGLILLVRGVAVELLLLTRPDVVGPDQRWWTLVLWNPWFVLGGIVFVIAAAGYRERVAA